jgi:ABC-2 type transport system ATP-binding protein
LTTHYLEEADALADRIGVINKGSIIAEGTPAQIKARTAGKKIRCVTQLTAAAIKDIPQVLEVSEDREAMVIHTANAESVLRRLLSLDQQISGIEVTSAGLEEAFLALTRDDSSKN